MRYGIIGLALMMVLVIVVNVPYASYVILAILMLGAAVWVSRRETYRPH